MRRFLAAFAVAAVAVVIVVVLQLRSAQRPIADGIVGRVVSEGGGAEAGVWVIAEADGLPTEYRKIVVTDDEGQFVIPSLPAAGYQVWVRGYGLRDSQKVRAKVGSTMELRVAKAATPQEAAQIYPANHWLSLLEPPAEAELRGAAAGGEAGVFAGAPKAAAPGYASQAAWIAQFKLNCILCHQIGSLITRSRPPDALEPGLRKASMMSAMADMLGRERVIRALGDWSTKIATGAVPPSPARPAGAERNIVITEWGWGDGFTYAHDEVATDKRDPTRYAHGPVYGVDIGNDRLLSLDPKTHRASMTKVPTRDGFDTPWCDQTYQAPDSEEILPMGVGSLGCPAKGGESGYAGKYDNPANPHNPMMDGSGRVWMTTQIRREWTRDLPEFCKAAPEIATHVQHRQLGYYDTKSDRFVLIDTCYGTHHLQFDAKGVLWTSGDSWVIGWFDPAKFDPANPDSAKKAQGWSEVIVDSNGDGRKDTPVVGFHYGVIPNAADGTVWTAVVEGLTSPAGLPGRILRYDPATDTHEVFSPPEPGFGPRGLDVDTRGNIWIGLGGSGHLARFDRGKCAKTWGAGGQCPEGWTLWPSPGPRMRGVADASADFHYYVWVDQFDTLGMGRDTVILNGTGSDSLLAFDPRTERFTVIRMPYPLNTYTRGLDGRIDDPAAGWKGRGLWFTNGLDPVLHSEVPKSYVGWVQFRPDPLAH
jgi:hypothetical protein